MTKKTQIEIMKAMVENTIVIYEYQRKKNPEWANELLREVMTIETCINILTDKEYAQDLAKIYGVA